ncbi:alpha/beta hydrolase family protein [Nocardia sp. NPDC058176]|uniref:alpha/beta hydrolase family protein n=1 Tax=Nocardia sp. NPDC058176 TaxID=3346368 RepID=UPI0036D7630E
MSYNPFDRGPHPVGVRSDSWRDSGRDRELPVEIWYPATDDFTGDDLDPARQDAFLPGWATEEDLDGGAPEDLVRQAAVRDATVRPGTHPLILLVHGWAGYRREATFLGTHLASHGYVVVAPDVLLSTFGDVDAFLSAQPVPGDPQALVDHVTAIAEARRADVPFLIDSAAARLDIAVDAVGITGASFGGWSSLQAPASDPRIAATVPMCPAGGRAPADGGYIGSLLDWNWHRPAPTLLLVADRDSLLPLDGQFELLRRVPAPDRQMVVLANADHNHFVDDIDTGQQWLAEFADRVARIFPVSGGNWPLIARSVVPRAELCSGDSAQLAWRGLITAHMDAHLRAEAEAQGLLDGGIARALADRGVVASVVDDRRSAVAQR